MRKYDKVIYISHGYGGKLENLSDITNKLKSFVKLYPNYLFISPVNMYHKLYDITDYQEGLDMCLYLLENAGVTEMWVCDVNYKNSIGCMAEIERCKELNITVKYFVSDTEYSAEPLLTENNIRGD